MRAGSGGAGSSAVKFGKARQVSIYFILVSFTITVTIIFIFFVGIMITLIIFSIIIIIIFVIIILFYFILFSFFIVFSTWPLVEGQVGTVVMLYSQWIPHLTHYWVLEVDRTSRQNTAQKVN